MRFAHVSDLHLLTPDSISTKEGANTRTVAEAIVRDLARIAASLDLVVVSAQGCLKGGVRLNKKVSDRLNL